MEYDGQDIILRCRVQPRASRDEFAGFMDGAVRIRITAPPVDGKANTHLLKFLAGQFGVPKRQVQLLQGETGRQKRIRIQAPVRIPGPLQEGAPDSP
jgi:uncharacterized protein (TIGR00251 family)